MRVESIKKETQNFQDSVKKLSSSISKNGSLWKDNRFFALSASISEVAKQSMNVMVASERCCCSIDKFYEITAEKF